MADRSPPTAHRGRGLWRAAQILAAIVVVYFLYRYVARNWTEIRHASDAIEIHAGYLVLAALVILFTYAMLIGAWRTVVTGWGDRLDYPTAARIWCLSNLGKYLPGRIWQITGMAAMAQQAGVRAWAAAGSAVVVQLINIATGALITAIFAPDFGHPLLILLAGALTALAAGALTSARGAAMLSRAIARMTGRTIELHPVKMSALLVAAVITALQWVLYGVALTLCARGLTGKALPATAAIGVFTGAYVAGLVNVLTANGLGTREYILLTWLAVPIGSASATVVTVGSRLLMTATELIAALVTLPLLRARVDVRST